MSASFDPYRELGLSPEAATEPELVRAAFKALAKKYHPDAYPDAEGKARAEEKMRALNEAQRLILSGEYRPPPPQSMVSLVREERQQEPVFPAVAKPTTKPISARTVPMGPMMVATLILLASLAAPVLLGRDHLAEATRLAEQGKWTQALEKVDQAVSDDPRDGQAYLLRARLWQKLDKPERAKTDLANARGLLSSLEYERARTELFPSPTPAPSASQTPSTWKPKPP